MTPELIKQWADKAGFYDTGLDQWVVPCSDILNDFAALVAAHQRELDATLCAAIDLDDYATPATCARAIRGMKT